VVREVAEIGHGGHHFGEGLGTCARPKEHHLDEEHLRRAHQAACPPQDLKLKTFSVDLHQFRRAETSVRTDLIERDNWYRALLESQRSRHSLGDRETA